MNSQPLTTRGNARYAAIVFWCVAGILLVTTIWFMMTVAGHVQAFQWNERIAKFGGQQFCNVLAAFAIGCLGSWSFIIGVTTGLIARAQRNDILLYLSSSQLVQALYVFCGGIIAAVFQLGQPSSFAPIQALVLGATWPSVLSQYLSSASTSTSQDPLPQLARAASVTAPASGSSPQVSGELLTLAGPETTANE